MVVKIRTDGGYYIEVDNESELRMALKVLGESQPRLPLEIPDTPPQAFDHGDLLACIRSIPKQRAKLLVAALANNPDGLWDRELHSRISVKDNLAMSGVLTSLYRHAEKYGFKQTDIIDKREEGYPKKSYHYKLTHTTLKAYGEVYTPQIEEDPNISKDYLNDSKPMRKLYVDS